MLIYENAVIGNFLFGAGASYGFRRRAQGMPVICINLLQQTPADQRLGDALLHTSAFMRVQLTIPVFEGLIRGRARPRTLKSKLVNLSVPALNG